MNLINLFCLELRASVTTKRLFVTSYFYSITTDNILLSVTRITTMALACKGVFVVGAKRTPFCKYGGLLRELQASHAFAAAARNALYSAKLEPSLVDSTIIGNVNFLSQCDGGKTPRYCGIYSGVPIEKPSLGVNKACGSGLQAVINGALEIITGTVKLCLTGGTEVMSSLPLLVRNVRFRTTLGMTYHLEDYISGFTLQQMAESVAKKHKISRKMADNFACNSRQKWKTASRKDVQEELTSITVPFKNKHIEVDKDDLLDMDTDYNNFINASPILPDGITVTSLNSSVPPVPERRAGLGSEIIDTKTEQLMSPDGQRIYGEFLKCHRRRCPPEVAPADGAAALVLADEETIRRYHVKPLARVVAYACVGVDPFGSELGAVSAVTRLLKVTNMRLEDVDLFEVNETFASQAVAIVKELKIEEHRVNVGGGALVLGHPVAATGARMAVHLVHQINLRNVKRGIAASCCGGGQGVAVMFEST